MITLISGLIGFFASLMPEGIKLWRDASDKKHELTLLKLQMDFQMQGKEQRLEEVRLAHEATERVALYQTYKTGVEWVDAYNGTVRPTIAYAFFLLYAAVKFWQFGTMGDRPWLLWTEEDQAVFTGIISFYFGQRAVRKLR